MNKYLGVSLLAFVSLTASAQLPGELSWSQYTGDSFVANWESSANADITVFTNNGKTAEQSVKFADIISNGKINMFAAAALEPMFQLSFGDGLDAVGEIDGTDAVVMSKTDDAITIMSPNGFIRKLKIKGKVIGVEGSIDFDVCPYLQFTPIEQNGESTGVTFSTYANQLNNHGGEYDYGDFLNDFYKALSGVRLKFVKDEHMVGELAITSIECVYEEREVLVDKQPVDGDSYKVEGCNPGLPYFYYLGSKDGSMLTPIMTVDGFIPPSTIEGTPTSQNSFTASWSTAYKASEVEVSNYEVKTYEEAATAYVYYDDFDAADRGTLAMPDMVTSLDPYTSVAGWETYPYAGRIAVGMIGTFKSYRQYPIQGGYIYSPALDLSGNDGKYTIATRIYGTPGDVITVYRAESVENYMLISHKLTIGEDGWVEEEWDMTDGQIAQSGDPVQSIHFESGSLSTFLLDYLHVSQEVPAGYIQYLPSGSVTTDASLGEVEFSELKEGATYAFRVRSKGYDLLGDARTSEWSDYVKVSLPTAGIENVVADDTAAFDPAAPAQYFTPDGRQADAGTRGLVIVRQGARTFKMVR